MNKHVKIDTLPAHPAADAYRLMDEGEFVELVASIKAIGLSDPITVGIVGSNRWIIDGRNRERACAEAGVMAEYEEITFADEDALRQFVAGRNERRSITKGQKAMAWAMMFPEPAKGGRGKKTVESFNSFDKAELSRARAVLRFSPELAERIRDGLPLQETYEAVKVARSAGGEGLSLAEVEDMIAAARKGDEDRIAKIAETAERSRQELSRRYEDEIAQAKRDMDARIAAITKDKLVLEPADLKALTDKLTAPLQKKIKRYEKLLEELAERERKRKEREAKRKARDPNAEPPIDGPALTAATSIQSGLERLAKLVVAISPADMVAVELRCTKATGQTLNERIGESVRHAETIKRWIDDFLGKAGG